MARTFAGRRTLRAAWGWLLAAALAGLMQASAWAALAIDAVVVTNRSGSATSITSPALSTASGGELLLAFVATDARGSGMTVTGVTGGGLTWVLVRRTNAQLGTAEVWRAFATGPLAGFTVRANLSQSVAASITVVGFTGADASGSNGAGAIGATAGASAGSGAPGASLVTTRDNSWVFGVGNDYDRAVARTLPAGQTLVSQYLATVGDTYWVQQQSAPTAAAGTAVAINDTAPTTDRYNLSIVEVRAAPPAGATYSVSGSVAPASIGAGATLTLRQGATTIASATADAGGAYRFASVAGGTYTVTPSKAGVSFSPATQTVTVSGGPATVGPFTAIAASYVVSGSLTPTSLGAGAAVTLSQGPLTIATATANASGLYSFPAVVNGTYTVTPSKAGVVFNPLSRGITVNGAPVAVAAFTAAAVGSFTVSGSVTPATLGAGATVILRQATTTVASTTVTASGTYSFAGVANGSYTVTPSKSTLAPGASGIDTVDVVAIQRHFLNQGTPLSGCRLASADVNGLNGVDTVDVIAVQRFFLGFTSGIANVGKYQFNPASRTYSGIATNQSGENYDTLIFGDVATGFVH